MQSKDTEIDNVTFAKLVDEAIKRIPQLTKEWTDYNPSDPGITFIELFAWLVEMQMFYMDQVTERHLLKYLRLLGTQPRPALPARVQVAFSSSGQESFLLVVGQQVAAKTEDGTLVPFETIDDLTIVPVELTSILVNSEPSEEQENPSYKSIRLPVNGSDKFFYAFGANPTANSKTQFYLGFNKAFPGQSEISIAIYLYEDDLPPLGSHDEEPEIIPSANVLWEYSAKSQTQSWSPLNVTNDSTLALCKSGFLKFTAPMDMATAMLTLNDVSEPQEQFWLRCTLQGGAYEIPPRIRSIRLNTVEAIQMKRTCGFAEQQSDAVTELPNQVFKLSYSPVMSRRLVVKVKEGQKWIQWTPVNSFDNSNSVDRHFVLAVEDSTTGPTTATVFFGNGVNGMQPPIGADNIKIISYIADAPAEQDVFSFTDTQQSFALKTVPPILKDTLIYTSGDKALWRQVEDFDASKQDDRHFTLDRAKGELQLGNGVFGRIGAGDKLVAAIYYSTMAEKGNVKAATINQVVNYSGAAKNLAVTNFEDAVGGTEGESLEAAVMRAQLDLKKTYKAVTLADFEELAKRTPGLRLARAKASWTQGLGGKNEPVKIIVIPYRLPGSPFKLAASDGFKKTVCLHLDRHRLLTTPIQVIDPKYVEVSVQATIKAKSLSSVEGLKGRVVKELNRFFDPLVGYDGSGWPFGKTIYKSSVCATLEGIDGVDCVQSLILDAKGNGVIMENAGDNLKIPSDCTTVSGIHQIEVLESSDSQGGDCK